MVRRKTFREKLNKNYIGSTSFALSQQSILLCIISSEELCKISGIRSPASPQHLYLIFEKSYFETLNSDE